MLVVIKGLVKGVLHNIWDLCVAFAIVILNSSR